MSNKEIKLTRQQRCKFIYNELLTLSDELEKKRQRAGNFVVKGNYTSNGHFKNINISIEKTVGDEDMIKREGTI